MNCQKHLGSVKVQILSSGASNIEQDEPRGLLFAFSNCFAVSSPKNVGEYLKKSVGEHTFF